MLNTVQQAQAIRDLFEREYGFRGKPASERQIAAAEGKLSTRLPDVLRELYRLTDGLWFPGGDPPMYPLKLLVPETRQFREFAAPLGGAKFICFGFNEGWRYLALLLKRDGGLRIVSYDPGVDIRLRDRGTDLLRFYIDLNKWCQDAVRSAQEVRQKSG